MDLAESLAAAAQFGNQISSRETDGAKRLITAGLRGHGSEGLDLLSTGGAALLVGVAVFAVFGYLGLRLTWLLRRLSFELRYRLSCPPWDTGVTPPELRAFVEDEHTAPGRALDLGCGTGTNIVYLARRGWDAVGVDFAPRAVALARRRAADTHLAQARFVVGDVTRLQGLGDPFDLAVDIGCLHSIAQDARRAYASSLVAQLRPGATYLLYAFSPPEQLGIARRDVEALFSPALTLVSYLEGTGRPSAWYRFSYA